MNDAELEWEIGKETAKKVVLAVTLISIGAFLIGHYAGQRSSRKRYSAGWDIVQINKGVLRDTRNTGLEIFFRNGACQLWEMASGETIP